MYKNIMFPVDVADEASWRRALPTVLKLAKSFDAHVHVMTVLPEVGSSIVSHLFPEAAGEELSQHAGEALQRFTAENIPDTVDYSPLIVSGSGGSICDTITDAAEQLKVDLIVMAAHRPELKDFWVASNSEQVVKHADCSVLIVRDKSVAA